MIPILGYCTGKGVGHDDHTRKNGWNAQQQTDTQLKFTHLSNMFQNIVIIVRLLSLTFVRYLRSHRNNNRNGALPIVTALLKPFALF